MRLAAALLGHALMLGASPCGSASACRASGRRRPGGDTCRRCARPVTGSRVNTIGQRDVAAAVARPAAEDGQARRATAGRSRPPPGRAPSARAWARPWRRRRGRRACAACRANEPGMRRSSSFATRADSSSSRSTPSAARHALRRAEGVDEHRHRRSPATFSKSRATLPPAGPFDTRSVISVISRSRETGAVTRRSWPRFSRWATNSRRSANAMRGAATRGSRASRASPR